MCRSHTKEGEKCFERSETFGRKRSKKYSENILYCSTERERGKDFWKKYWGKDEGEEGHLEIMASFCTSATIFSFNSTGGQVLEQAGCDLGRKVNNLTQLVNYTCNVLALFLHRKLANTVKKLSAQVLSNLVNLIKQIIQQNVNWAKYIIFNSTGNGGQMKFMEIEIKCCK